MSEETFRVPGHSLTGVSILNWPNIVRDDQLNPFGMPTHLLETGD